MEVPMRSSRVSTILLCAIYLFPQVVSHAQVVSQLKSTVQGLLTVQVSINGSGPYSFFLDTGSNRTLVRKELLENLSGSSGTPVPVHMATGISYAQETVVSSVAVAGLTVHDLPVEGIDAAQLNSLDGSFQGVLGEDFLKHFDVLIDNRAKTLTLDEASELARSLDGDRLPLSFSGTRGGHSTPNRLIFDLKLPSSSEIVHFLVDSGSNHTMVFPTRLLPFARSAAPAGTLRTLGGSGRCYSQAGALVIGKDTLPSMDLAFCEGMRVNTDVDGLLPTSTFTRLFISHAGAYAIANPRTRKPSAASPARISAGQ
jgi:hypothetical protein